LAVDVFAPMKLPALPVYYYLDHFTEMRSFVESTYAPVLTVGAKALRISRHGA